MFRKTLIDDLQMLIMKITKTGRDAQILNHIAFDDKYRQELSMALKLRDDLKGLQVTYTDSDFILSRNTKNKIGKLLNKHKNSHPPQFMEQRSKVTDEHLNGVLNGTEKELHYGYCQFYTGIRYGT